MAAKRLAPFVCLLLAAVLAAPAAADARPNAGSWKGKETKWWEDGRWQTYTSTWRVAFRVKGRRVLRFRSAGYIPWTCSDGSEESTKAPWVMKARLFRSGGRWKLKGKRTVHGSRRMTTYISGSFRGTRAAKGKIVVKRQGCGSYRSLWKAKGPKPRRRRGTTGPGRDEPGCIMAPIPTYPYYICLN